MRPYVESRQEEGAPELEPYALDTEVLRQGGVHVHYCVAGRRLAGGARSHPTYAGQQRRRHDRVHDRSLSPEAGRGPQGARRWNCRDPGFSTAEDGHWDWAAPPATPAPDTASEGAERLMMLLPDGSVSLGTVELEGDSLKLETNSPQRAVGARALLEPVIGPFVGEVFVDVKTLEEIAASRPANEEPPPPPDLSAEEERKFVHETLDRHYRAVLDQPVPALGDVSPRDSAKTTEGRERLVGWLKGSRTPTRGSSRARRSPATMRAGCGRNSGFLTGGADPATLGDLASLSHRRTPFLALVGTPFATVLLIMRRRVLFAAFPAALLASRAQANPKRLDLAAFSSQTIAGTAAQLFADKAGALSARPFQIEVAELPPMIPFAAIAKASALASFPRADILARRACPRPVRRADAGRHLRRGRDAAARRTAVLRGRSGAARPDPAGGGTVAAGSAVEHLSRPLWCGSPRRPVRAGRDGLHRRGMGGAVHPGGGAAILLFRSRDDAVQRLHVEHDAGAGVRLRDGNLLRHPTYVPHRKPGGVRVSDRRAARGSPRHRSGDRGPAMARDQTVRAARPAGGREPWRRGDRRASG